jgi:hypothetical protein
MDSSMRAGQTDHMAAKKKGPSSIASMLNGVGFLLAALLVMHVVLVLFRIPAESPFAQAVERVAVPLALFFPGMIVVHNAVLQVLVDYGLAAAFWIVVAAVFAKIVG